MTTRRWRKHPFPGAQSHHNRSRSWVAEWAAALAWPWVPASGLVPRMAPRSAQGTAQSLAAWWERRSSLVQVTVPEWEGSSGASLARRSAERSSMATSWAPRMAAGLDCPCSSAVRKAAGLAPHWAVVSARESVAARAVGRAGVWPSHIRTAA